MSQVLKLTETPIEITHLSASFEPTAVYIETYSTPLAWYQEIRGTLLGHGQVNINIMEADTENKVCDIIETITRKALDMEELETQHRAHLRARRTARDEDDEKYGDDENTDEKRTTYYDTARKSLGLRRRTRQQTQIQQETTQVTTHNDEKEPDDNAAAENNAEADNDEATYNMVGSGAQPPAQTSAVQRRVSILEQQIEQAVQHRQHRLCAYIRKCIQKDGKLRDACFAAGFKTDSGDIGKLWIIICKKYILPHPSMKRTILTHANLQKLIREVQQRYEKAVYTKGESIAAYSNRLYEFIAQYETLKLVSLLPKRPS